MRLALSMLTKCPGKAKVYMDAKPVASWRRGRGGGGQISEIVAQANGVPTFWFTTSVRMIIATSFSGYAKE